ncbi:cytochrome c oxidase subunit II [Sphingomonas crusticola]|uniref:cytochrome c oxidase subunit II n=1 Tax=Sphingomonas crusticola TaxID=1697973 RepID=UPI000E21EEF0|nr:c-type cytochrome [Sphingomonas crusticola]
MRRLIAMSAPLMLAGCGGNQSPLSPGGDQAVALYNLLLLSIVVCGIIYVLVLAGLGWGLYRRRTGSAVDQSALDRGVWVAAGVILVGLTVLIVGSFLADRAVFATRGRDAMKVRVTGHQYWWRIEYRDAATGRWIETANELHLPQGRTTRVSLGSADVIHSFWVPNVAGKLDMIPGRRNLIDLTPRQLGWFRGQCSEYCGAQHAHMAFDVKVEPPAAFDAWLAAQALPAAAPSDPVAQRGAAAFAGPCAACHVVHGSAAAGRAGPDLTHLAARRSIAAGTLPMTRGNLQGWITQPQALKPGTMMPTIPLNPADANAIAHYLATRR